MDVTLSISHHTKSVGGGGDKEKQPENRRKTSEAPPADGQNNKLRMGTRWFVGSQPEVVTDGGWGVRGRDRGREGFKRIG